MKRTNTNTFSDEQLTAFVSKMRQEGRVDLTPLAVGAHLPGAKGREKEVIKSLLRLGLVRPRQGVNRYPILAASVERAHFCEASTLDSRRPHGLLEEMPSKNATTEQVVIPVVSSPNVAVARSVESSITSVPEKQDLRRVPLTSIFIEQSIQPRAKLDMKRVRDFAELMSSGQRFPAVVVFELQQGLTLADGAHRLEALKIAGHEVVAVQVMQGTLREAALFAIQANAAHGQSLTRAEKKLAAERLLRDQEWSQWSDAEIGRHCGISARHIGRIRKANHPDNVMVKTRKCRSRFGVVREMDTSRMGPGKAGDTVAMTGCAAAVRDVVPKAPSARTCNLFQSFCDAADPLSRIPASIWNNVITSLDPALLYRFLDLLDAVNELVDEDSPGLKKAVLSVTR